jgi:hypothetical protein
MRLALGLALSAAVLGFGCGGGSSGDDGSDDDGADVDALPAPGQGFQIVTPDIEIPAGGEITYCYYTTVTLDQAAGIKKWSSVMTPGSHHLIVFFTNDAQEADGTLTANCGFAGGSGLNFPIWSYSAQTATNEMDMPAGIGMQISQTQHMFVQMHYLNTNPTDPITVHVTINGETYAPEEQYTPAAAFVTYSTDIHIDGGVGMTGSITHTCSVPDGATFFTLGTHSHRRSVETWVTDGDTEVFRSDDWEHPTDLEHRIDAWADAPYHQFSGDLTYHCDYVNDLAQAVTTGDSANVNEMCMAVGYYFPATTAKFCIDENIQF